MSRRGRTGRNGSPKTAPISGWSTGSGRAARSTSRGRIEEAVKEVRRVSKMGLRGLELSCSWDMEPMWHPVWEPLWQAVADVDLPLHFHTFPTTAPRSRTEARQVQRAAMFTGVSAFQ